MSFVANLSVAIAGFSESIRKLDKIMFLKLEQQQSYVFAVFPNISAVN